MADITLPTSLQTLPTSSSQPLLPSSGTTSSTTTEGTNTSHLPPSPPVSSTSSSTSSQSSSVSVTSLSSVTSTTSSLVTSSASSLPSSSTTTTLSTPAHLSLSTSSGRIITVTSYVDATPTSTVTPASTAGGSKSFFENKAAVAGTFSAVGVVIAVILFVLVTNAVRRRRAERFDRDVADATAEAMATARSPTDFENDHYGTGPGTGLYPGYSDNSHGTYQQSPVSYESYGMSQIPHYDPVTSPGAAGIGVTTARGRSLRGISTADVVPGYDGFGPTINEEHPPYPAFAGPGSQPHEAYTRASVSGFAAHNDLLEAAGIAGGAAAGTVGSRRVNHGPSTRTTTTNYSDLSRGKSLGGQSLGHEAYYGRTSPLPARSPSSSQGHSGQSESYAAHYQPGFQPEVYQPFASADGHSPLYSLDPYGGYIDDPPSLPGQLPNPFAHSSGSGGTQITPPSADKSEESHYSDEDEEERDRLPRILKVANE